MINFKKILPVILLGAAVVFGTNPLLKLGLEKAGNAVFGARTELGGFSLNFLTGRLRITRLSVANKNAPLTNLFETGRFSLGLNPEQLLYKRVVIEQLTIDGILLGTPRRTSGALPQKKRKAAAEKKPLNLAKMAQDLQLDPAALSKAFQVAPPRAKAAAAQMLQENEQRLAAAQKQLAAFDLNQELATLNLAELSSIQISGPEDLAKLKNLAAEKQKGLAKIAADFEARQNLGVKALQEAQQNLTYLDEVRRQDMDRLLGALDFGNYDLSAIGQALLGPKINGWLDSGMNYWALLQKYIPPPKQKTPPKARFKGETIIFPGRKTLPRFWIGRAGLSGTSGQCTVNELTYSGYLHDAASEQQLIGRPTILDIQGVFTKRPQSLLRIKAILDHRDRAQDSLNFTLSGYDLNGAQFWDDESLPLKIIGGQGRLDVAIKIAEERLSGQISFRGQNLRYAPLAATGLARLAAEAIQAAPELRLDIGLGGTVSAPELQLTTNLDALIKTRLEKELGDQLEKARAQLTAEYDRVVGDARAQAGAALDTQQKALQELLSQQQAALDAAQGQLEARQKALENQLNEQADEYKKQLENTLQQNGLPGLKF